jgi:hypothetical protein
MAGQSMMPIKENSVEKTESEKLFGFKEKPFSWDDNDPAHKFEVTLINLEKPTAPTGNFCPKKTMSFGPKRTVGKEQNRLMHHYMAMKTLKINDFDTYNKAR